MNDTKDSAPAPIDGSAALVRKMVWDASPCTEAENIIRALGMVNASEDVAKLEHGDSHARLQRLASVYPLILVMVQNLTYIHTAAALAEHPGGEDVPDFVKASVADTFGKIIHSSVVTAFSTAIDMGIVRVG